MNMLSLPHLLVVGSEGRSVDRDDVDAISVHSLAARAYHLLTSWSTVRSSPPYPSPPSSTSSSPANSPTLPSVSLPSMNTTFSPSHTPAPPDGQDVSLPTPNEITQHGVLLSSSEVDKSVWKVKHNGVEMIVKRGTAVKAEEAEWTEMVRTTTGLPVPRVYGVQTVDGETLIYLEVLRGTTLYEAFPYLSPPARMSVTAQIKAAVQTLHSVEAPGTTQLGGFGGKNLLTLSLALDRPALFPPFSTVSSFNQWIKQRCIDGSYLSAAAWEADVEPFLAAFPRLALVHGDLTPFNILVEGDKVTGLIDWEFAGFYPAWVDGVSTLRRTMRGGRPSVWTLLGKGIWGTSDGKGGYERVWPVVEALSG